MAGGLSRRRLLSTTATLAVGVPVLAACERRDANPAPSATVAPQGLTFPPGFVWGAATSAYQIEGAAAEDGRGPSIWDTFSHQPGTIVDGSTGDIACDHYHRWAGDLDLMRDLGIRSYRFSIAWPRIMPTGRGDVNSKGLDFYKRLVEGLHERGIAPMATLFHWDLPQPLQDEGGWENRDCASWFADYAEVMFRELGAQVPTWLTINEPKTIVQVGYTYGSMAPGKRDAAAAAVAAHHLALAHGRAVQAFRAAGVGGRIGPALNLAPAYPAQTGADAQVELADGVQNRLYLDPIFRGAYPTDAAQFLGERPWAALQGVVRDGDLAIIGTGVDLLGVNYYNPVFVDSQGGNVTLKPTSIATWEQIYPDGLHDLLVRLNRDYPGVPLVITENGIPNAGAVDVAEGVDDPQRVEYLRDHLAAAHQAIADGARLEGYHVWSLLDNFEWAQGYTQRWGIVHVDFTSQQRTPKGSAAWYRDVIARNGI
ncbi:MAG TPA: GH1 family beta-glucosidase [Micromonosporaceae bacterium]